MFEILTSFVSSYRRFAPFLFGALLSSCFAPLFFYPSLIAIGLFAFQIRKAESYKEAFWIGYFFGFGFFLAGLYWICIGVSVYISQFWWAIPFALFGLPCFLGFYFAFLGYCSFFFAKKPFFINSFSCLWIIFELLRTYLFTGFPWNLIGYSMAFSDEVIQSASIVGIYGIGLIVVLSFANIYYLLEASYSKFSINLGMLLVIWGSIFYYGNYRLTANPTAYTSTKVRLVQPSIAQTDKWTMELFWSNFNLHKELSTENHTNFVPDLIIWPESAVILQPTFVKVYNALKSVVSDSNAILITGGVTDNFSDPSRSDNKMFASIYAIDQKGQLAFDYHKSHLVPFGEYVPLSSFLPISKLTPGDIPYSPGPSGEVVNLSRYNLQIRPLLCYEIIFPGEVLMDNRKADVILNLTNDAYYGNSSGPYQHFYMAKLRAVENGLPIIRVANNGISGIIDSVGRVVVNTNINDITYIDGNIPVKLPFPTLYSVYKNWFLYIYLVSSLAIVILLRVNNKINKP